MMLERTEVRCPWRNVFLLLLVLAYLKSRVSLADHSEGHPAETAEMNWTKAITFNTALTPTNLVAGYAERLKAFKDSLVMDTEWKDSDLVCLQEVHSVADQQAIALEARKIGLNYAYSDALNRTQPSTPSSAKACEIGVSAPFLTCASASGCGAKATPSEILNCLASSCTTQLGTVLNSTNGQECVNCMTTVPGGASAIQSCAFSIPRSNYYTKFGLLLLSRKPLQKTSWAFFSEFTNLYRRGYLQAEVDDIGTVLCTHLVPFAEGQTYLGRYGSFENENKQNVDKLLAALTGKRGIVMGDLNSGPAVPGKDVQALFATNFQSFMSEGNFIAPYVTDAGDCTFCVNTRLQQISGFPVNESYNQVLDHILLQEDIYVVRSGSVKRLFANEDAVSVQTTDGNVSVALSDHYAVQVEFRRKESLSSRLTASTWTTCTLLAMVAAFTLN